MKTDEESGEADEPPEEPPSSECSSKKSEREENEELQWARRHVPEERSGPGLVFRKTELHDRPPGTGGSQPTTVISERRDRILDPLTARLDAIDSRLDDIENRIDRVTGQLGCWIHASGKTEVS